MKGLFFQRKISKKQLLINVIALMFVFASCTQNAEVTEVEKQATIEEISIAIDSLNEGWRRADFSATMQLHLDEGVFTFNDSRSSIAAFKEIVEVNPTGGMAGQYIADYEVRYDVFSPNVVITSWEGEFARILPDSSRTPTQVALSTLVWKLTAEGWRILHYHESTKPKAEKIPSKQLSKYVGTFESNNARYKFKESNGTLNMYFEEAASSTPLESYSKQEFGYRGNRLTFVYNQDSTVHGVLIVSSTGLPQYAWRVKE